MPSVSAVDPLGNTYAANDTAAVTVLDPAISLVKTVSQTLVPAGATGDYTFLVTNVGHQPGRGRRRPGSSPCATSATGQPGLPPPVLVAKEGATRTTSWTGPPRDVELRCTGHDHQPTADLAAVDALGGSTVDAQDPGVRLRHRVRHPFHPAIEVEKSASPTHLNGPGEVTYTYQVRNTGDVPLAGVKSITDDTCSPVTYVSGTRTATTCSTHRTASSRTRSTRRGTSPARPRSTRTPPTP